MGIRKSKLVAGPFLALSATASTAVILDIGRHRWVSTFWFPIAIGAVAAIAIISLVNLIALEPPIGRRSHVTLFFLGGIAVLGYLPFLWHEHWLLSSGAIVSSLVMFLSAFGTLFNWTGLKNSSWTPTPPFEFRDDWLERSTTVDDVSFDVAFLVQRQLVIMRNQAVSLRERFPNLKGDPITQPNLSVLLEEEHDYFRLALARDVVGNEVELLRYYRSVLSLCNRQGLDPKTNRDCRCCFGIVPLILLPNRIISLPPDSDGVAGSNMIMNLLLATSDGTLFCVEDQTGDNQVRSLGERLYLHQSNEGTELVNVCFLKEPFQRRVRIAMERMETLVQTFRRDLGGDFWNCTR